MKLRPDDSGRPLWSREEVERIWRDNTDVEKVAEQKAKAEERRERLRRQEER